jgi:hypothetical protein
MWIEKLRSVGLACEEGMELKRKQKSLKSVGFTRGDTTVYTNQGLGSLNQIYKTPDEAGFVSGPREGIPTQPPPIYHPSLSLSLSLYSWSNTLKK